MCMTVTWVVQCGNTGNGSCREDIKWPWMSLVWPIWREVRMVTTWRVDCVDKIHGKIYSLVSGYAVQDVCQSSRISGLRAANQFPTGKAWSWTGIELAVFTAASAISLPSIPTWAGPQQSSMLGLQKKIDGVKTGSYSLCSGQWPWWLFWSHSRWLWWMSICWRWLIFQCRMNCHLSSCENHGQAWKQNMFADIQNGSRRTNSGVRFSAVSIDSKLWDFSMNLVQHMLL